MTTRNNSVEAGSDYKPAVSKPLDSFSSSTYVESELTRTDVKPTETAGGVGAEAKETASSTGGAQGYSETLFGPSAVNWGAKSEEPAVLDFSTEGGDNPFADKFNSLVAENSLFDNPFAEEFTDLKPAGQAKDADKGNTKVEEKKTGTDPITAATLDVVKGITEVPEQLAGLFKPNEIAKTIGSFFSGDQEAARIVNQAKQGKANLDAQDAQYLKQWRGPADNGRVAPPAEGDDPAKYTHKNGDGSSYDVTDGKISAFTTAPTANNPDGLTYKNIKYDSNNQITSYETPFNQRHTRVNAANKDGFATWQSTTLDGKPSPYGGAGSTQWSGKPAVDDKGFHNLVTSGTYAGNMYSRGMDGAYTLTQPQYRGRAMTGLESTTTLADNTEVSRRGTFDSRSGQLNHDNTNISVEEGDGPKVSKVSFDETGKGKVIEEPKKTGIAGGESTMGMFDNLLGNAPEMLKNVESFEIQKTGKNSFHIDGDLANVYMQPPNVTVGGFGPFGGVSATPKGGVVDKFSLDLGFNDNIVNASNIQGINGTASLSRTGLFGRTKNIGSTSTSTTGMVWDTQNNTMTAKSPERNTVLSAQHFAADSLNGRLLGSETAEAKAKETLRSLDEHVKSAKLKQVKPGVFEGSLDLADNRMSIDTKIPGVKANLYMDDKIDFSLSKDGIKFKPGEVQLGTQIGNGLETRKSVSAISRELNDKGEPTMKIEFHDGKDAIRIPVGDSKPSAGKTEATHEPAKEQQTRPVITPHRVAPQQFHYDTQPVHRRFRRR
ncbi:hypothetical protein KF728_13725 [Candidatus Obscuribacterales bacterium]|nr:hypothetical protein [Candidatus Obscuribacterales bacterium]